MPSDSPAICQGCGILPSSCSGWLGSAFFLSHQLPAEVVCLSPVVQVGGPLLWLRSSRKLLVSSVMGYRSMLATVFRFKLPNISSDPVLHDLVHSFRIEAPVQLLLPPAWDLSTVLRFLNSSVFELLHRASLRNLTKKALFLVSLATAKRVGELQALSRKVPFVRSDACLSYVPEFVAKAESISNPLPRSLVTSLSDFAAGLDNELLLCPVRALHIYLDRTSSFSPLPRRLFLSPRRPPHSLSKNAISFFLQEVIHGAGAARPEVGSVRAHSVRGVSTSVAFQQELVDCHCARVCYLALQCCFFFFLSQRPSARVRRSSFPGSVRDCS